MAFERSTRLRRIRLAILTKPTTTGGLTQVDIPKVGLLSAVLLNISGTVTGTVTTPNANGFACIVNLVRLAVNSGTDLFNMSGIGYAWLFRDFVDLFLDPSPESTARSTITATTFDISMVLPVALNNRDTTGLIMLQNEQTVVSLLVNWEADATIVSAGGATTAATCEPIVEYFEVPASPKDWPDLGTLHQVLEDNVVAAGAGDVTYNIPRGNILAGVYHLSQGTTWTLALLRAQQGNIVYNDNPGSMEKVYNRIHGRGAALAGGALTGRNIRVLWDFLGSDGLGAYGSVRDFIDSARLTDLASIVTLAGAGTLKTVRRQLVPLRVN